MKPTAWSSLASIKKELRRKWARGTFFKVCEKRFPLRIPLKRPSSVEISEKYEFVRNWIGTFTVAENAGVVQIVWQEMNHRVIGRNRIPRALLFNSIDEVAAFIGASTQLALFRRLSEEVIADLPPLSTWVERYPMRLIALADDLPALVKTAQWIKTNPRPGIYLRQISVPGINTRFIESYRAVLSQWLDLLLPQSVIDSKQSGVTGFEARYGFCTRPRLVRFRVLDKRFYICGLSDLTLRAEEFCRLNCAEKTVYIVENDINGLAFPDVDESIVLFGRGYGFDYLADARWLGEKSVVYWGDIDTHGFAILNQLRKYFPRVCSMLMDRETFIAHKHAWVTEPSPVKVDLPLLTAEEGQLYRELCDNVHGSSLRLEQEYIEWGCVLPVIENRSKMQGKDLYI